MNIPLYVKEVWDELSMSVIFEREDDVLDQVGYYIDRQSKSAGFLELDKEFIESCKLSLSVDFVDVMRKGEDVEVSDVAFFPRKIDVHHDFSYIDLDQTYFITDTRYDSCEVNLVIDGLGKMSVLYEDGTIVDIGYSRGSAVFFDSRYHASLVDADTVFLLIDDIFYFQGELLNNSIFSQRVGILRAFDFDGSYDLCSIVKKKFCLVAGQELRRAVSLEMEFISPSHSVSRNKGAFLVSDHLKFVVFCSHGKMFAIEWEKNTISEDILEIDFTTMINRVKKQKYPVLQWLFCPRSEDRFMLERYHDDQGAAYRLKFLGTEFPPICRRAMDYRSILEMMHSMCVEVVICYEVKDNILIRVQNNDEQKRGIIYEYFGKIRDSYERLRFKYICESKNLPGCSFVLASRCHSDLKLLHSMRRVRLKWVQTADNKIKDVFYFRKKLALGIEEQRIFDSFLELRREYGVPSFDAPINCDSGGFFRIDRPIGLDVPSQSLKFSFPYSV